MSDTAQNIAKKDLVVLISMDGVGVAPPGPGNAVTLANTPNLDEYWPNYPHTYLEASGVHVGLPPGTDGNSEVGHTIMGAGKVIYQDVARVDNAIQNKSFFDNPELKGAFDHAKKYNSSVHVIGLVGHGKSHSAINHLFGLIKMGQLENFDPDRFFIHAIGDGRDSPPDMLADYMEEIMDQCIAHRMGRVVSMMGRFYAMDRDRRWDRIKLAYDFYTEGKGHIVMDVKKAIADSYKEGKTDEFIEPTAILLNEKDKPVKVQSNDAVIFFNFRPDRAIELSKAFTEEDFTGFERSALQNLYYVGMTKYADDLPKHIAFPPDKALEHMGKVLADHKVTQLRVAESEKFAHVTYFFNNGFRGALPGETQIEVPSVRDVLTYDQKPEMSQRWITDVFIEKIATRDYQFGLVNFAGPDMVGHTGNLKATIQAMEIADECVGRIVKKVLELDGAVIITADHGNAEQMINPETGDPDTDHTNNQVPCIIIKNDLEGREIPIGSLADIAPTILSLLHIEKPAEMTGRDLLAR